MVQKPRWHWSGISSFIYPWCGYPWCPWPSTQALLYLLPSKYLFLPSLQAHSSEKTFSIISLSVDLYGLSGSDPLLLIYNSKNVFLPVLTYSMSGLPVVTQHWKRKGQHLLTSIKTPFLLLWFLHRVELFFAFISHLDDISSWKSFMKVQVSSI